MPEPLVDAALGFHQRHPIEQARVGAKAGLVEGQRRDPLALRCLELRDIGFELRHRRAARIVYETPEQTRECRGGVDDRSTPHAAVDRVIEGPNTHVYLHDAPQAGGQARQARCQVLGVGEHQHVAVQTIAVKLQELGQVPGADLLLALDDDLHVNGQGSLGFEPGAQRGDVQQDAGLVVHHAATVQAPVLAQGRLEGRGLPSLETTGGLHIMVRGDQYRGGVVEGRALLPAHVGMRSLELQHLDLVEAGPGEQPRHGIGRPHQLHRIEAVGRNSGNARQLHQLRHAGVEAPIDG